MLEAPNSEPLAAPSLPRRGLPVTGMEVILLGLVLVGAFLIWQRNRDILCDMYDYSSVIVAAGKIEAGLKPYVDFRSTMQSGSYVWSRGVEKLFGDNYLALTQGGLGLILGGGLLLHLLWRRQFGPRLAAVFAGAVTLGGLAQHVVIFYNPVGLLCLAVVIAGVPQLCREHFDGNWRWWAVAGALMLGGINKINFHGLAMGMAGLIVLVAAVQQQISWRRLFVWWGGLVGVGVVLPWGGEMGWTGASPALWLNNVVGLAEERVGFVGRIFSAATYAGPTYDYHHYLWFKPLHTVGLLVGAGLILVVVRSTLAPAPKLALATLAGVGGIGGVLLTVTNVESIALTSQGTLLAAIAVAANLPDTLRRRVSSALGVAAGLWLVVGGYAAWQGSRVLYGQDNVDRDTYVRLENAPAPLRYLEGVRLEPRLHASLLLLAEDLAKIEQRDGDLSKVWFGPTLEWLERGHPESIMPRMPVWYHVGTALKASDGPWLVENMWAKGVTHFYLHPFWEGWPDEFQEYLNAFTFQSPVGVLRQYITRSESFTAYPAFADFEQRQEVMDLFNRTGSNLHLRATRWDAAERPTVEASPWGDYWAAPGNWSWHWKRGGRRMEGVFVAQAGDRNWSRQGPVKVNWRVIADPQGVPDVIWSGPPVELDADFPEAQMPFQFQAKGRPLQWEVTVEGEQPESIVSGWRAVRILHSGKPLESTPPPGLRNPGAATALTSPGGRVSWRRWTDTLDDQAAGLTDWTRHPFEIWSLLPPATHRVTARLEIEVTPDSTGVVPIFMLMWYKAGRLEMLRQIAAPAPSGVFEITGRCPEAGGWMGLIVRPANPDTPINSRFRFQGWLRESSN